MSQWYLLSLCLLAMAAASCTWTGKDGTHRTLVLGVGVISSQDLVKANATVTHSSMLGVALLKSPTNTGLLVGYSDSVVTQIPPQWDGHLSIDLSSPQILTMESLGRDLTTHQ